MGCMILVPSGRIDEVYLALVTNGFITFGRALFIPSSPRRTLWLAVLCALPTFGASVAVAFLFPERLSLPRSAFLTNNLFCAGFPTLLAAVGSRVISTLQAQVKEARQLGQYRLGEKLAEGGMGVLYKAHHALLRRPTVIKLLPIDKSSAEAVQRFAREVQLTARLTGPSGIGSKAAKRDRLKTGQRTARRDPVFSTRD